MLLRSGTASNFGPLRDVTKNDARGLYGHVANVMHTDMAYEVPAIGVEDYGEAEAGGALPQAAIQRLKEAAILARNKDVKKLKDIRPMFYSFLIKRLSTESSIWCKHTRISRWHMWSVTQISCGLSSSTHT